MTEWPPSHMALMAAPRISFDPQGGGGGGTGSELLPSQASWHGKKKICELAWLCSDPVQLCSQDRLPEGRGTSESCQVVCELH